MDKLNKSVTTVISMQTDVTQRLSGLELDGRSGSDTPIIRQNGTIRDLD